MSKYVDMSIDVGIDAEEVFSNLSRADRRELILDNLDELNDSDLIDELERRGYGISL